MSEPQFGCPVCKSTNIMVRSETEGYAYDAILRWAEDGEPAEVEPFELSPPEHETSPPPEGSEFSVPLEERLRRTRYTCWSCSAQFPSPTRVDTLPDA